MTSLPPSLIFTESDLQAAAGVLQASAAALEARGEALWPASSLTPERLSRHYPASGWRVAWHEYPQMGKQAVGTYVLLDHDPLFWPDDPPGEALYLHKLAVHPQAQGRGLAWPLLSAAVAEAQTRTIPHLRLDTASNRPKLCALYEEFGFQAVGERQVGAYHVVLYTLTVPPAP